MRRDHRGQPGYDDDCYDFSIFEKIASQMQIPRLSDINVIDIIMLLWFCREGTRVPREDSSDKYLNLMRIIEREIFPAHVISLSRCVADAIVHIRTNTHYIFNE